LSERIKIEIFDQIYHISGDLERAYVEQLAAFVDAKMRDVARSTGTVDSVKVAVLAALAFADELHSLRQRRDSQREELRERAERCLKIVERALEQSA
jgi:cell division protein ZapA